jgi:hypothetical protein
MIRDSDRSAAAPKPGTGFDPEGESAGRRHRPRGPAMTRLYADHLFDMTPGEGL